MASCYDNVPTPTDANGCVVTLDTKELVHKGETREVYGFFYSIRSKDWFVEFGEYEYIRLGACTMPDSWEKLEEDIGSIKDADCPCDYFNHSGCVMPCDSCPAHTVADDCVAELARDVLRRAKSLARRDAKALTPQPSPHEPEEVN